MKKRGLFLLMLSLSGCSTIDQMNMMVNESTQAIHRNREAVERSTCEILQNAYLVDQSTHALEENRHHLESVSSGS